MDKVTLLTMAIAMLAGSQTILAVLAAKMAGELKELKGSLVFDEKVLGMILLTGEEQEDGEE